MTNASLSSTPLVSVIIPCYNAERYLRKCLKSIVRQSLRDIEILPVNDGSTDSTLAIMRQFAASDSRVRVIDMPHNRGTQWARYEGIKAATGQFISFVDGDDFITPDHVETLYRAALAADADVVRSGYYWKVWKRLPWHKTYVHMGMPELIGKTIDHDEFMAHHHVRLMIFGPGLSNEVWAYLYRRSLFDGYAPPAVTCPNGEDRLLNLVILPQARRLSFIQEGGYYYRSGGAATGNSKAIARLGLLYTESLKIIDEMQLPAVYVNHAASTLLRMFHWTLQEAIVLGGSREDVVRMIEENLHSSEVRHALEVQAADHSEPTELLRAGDAEAIADYNYRNVVPPLHRFFFRLLNK